MRYFTFCALLYLASACTQIKLKVHNSDLDSTSLNIISFADFILPSKQIVADSIVLRNGEWYKTTFGNNQPSMLVIRNANHSLNLYVQPNQSYDIFLTNEGISIESEDKINETMVKLESSVGNFYNHIFKIESEKPADMRGQILSLLSDLLEFQKDHIGTDYQNQLIKYKLALCQSVAFEILQDRQAMDSLESAYLINQKIDFQNPEYINFLFDYYLRCFRNWGLRKQTYSDDLPELEVIKQEVNLIANDTVKQLAFFHMARNAYNSAWVSDNKEITEIVDELAQHGLHGDIRQSAEALANRYKLLSKGARLPDVTFTDLSSNTIRLSEFHGKYVLLDFWFIGCKPCQADVPYLKILHADFNSSLEIVSINPRDDLNKIKEYKNHEGLGWSFLKSDMDSEAMEILQVNFFPTYFLLDPDGNIILPPIDFSGEKDLYELIADQLKKYGIEQ